MFKIEKNIPIPPKCSNTSVDRRVKYPWRKMEVGDSIAIPINGRKAAVVRATITACTRRTTPDRRYTTRQIGDSIRVWRIE